MSTSPGQKVCFGSCQERRLFPLHYAPDWLGNQMSRPYAPHIGPGCYDNRKQYQQDQSRTGLPPLGKPPFNFTTQRFKSMTRAAEDSPGPGTYTQDAATNRRVSWPMCFGRPDWSRLPQPEKKSLRVKLNSEKEFIKHRSRVTYLSLYY